MSRIAILDLGTNTFHLLIADRGTGGRPSLVYHETIAVKLGEGLSEGTISREAFGRGIQALKKFRGSIEQYRPTIVEGVATSAIRSAGNGPEFIERIRTETGLIIQVIDGDQEAELIYKGVRAAVNLQKSSLIVDIGGGSVEFIICDHRKIFWKKSYPIGAARLMSLYHHTDPISLGEISALNKYLQMSLADLKSQLDIYRPELMVGSAGVFETFSLLQNPQYSPSFEKPAQVIDLKKLQEISEIIIKSTHAERENMSEIPAVRIDMIVVATILTNFILNISQINTLELSFYSLKEGILFGTAK